MGLFWVHSEVGSNLGRFGQLGGLVEHLGVVEHGHACKGEQLGTWEACKGQQGGALKQLWSMGGVQGARGRALACACIYSRPKLTCSHYEIFIKLKNTLKILKFLHNILDIYMLVL